MQDNPYSPPTAALVLPVENKPSAQAPFFAVSPLKLVLMSIFTCGLYELYWFYKNWQSIKLREKENISPFWRAVFGVFFCYSLFDEIREWQKEHGKGEMPAGWLAAGWILLTLAYKLPGPFGLISMASVAFLIPVQKVINDINRIEAPEHDPNSKITGVNWIAMVLGGLLLALALVGLFLPDNPG
ncbi:DUF4234 domain-containing protein [Dyella sp.]|uniref:DUF4234 domain-containing protein n=1 Tax=Dyella sp. TaxID=1869338 RepID=UPI002B466B6D|nr:DUF4234 domain-containing protein [Dyella sp.]HKT27352.1 DUF4234 domain-containing protein [Dyella sp.]